MQLKRYQMLLLGDTSHGPQIRGAGEVSGECRRWLQTSTTSGVTEQQADLMDGVWNRALEKL